MTPEQALELIEGYNKVPNEWLRDEYRLNLWELQQQIVESVWQNRETAVKTCNAIGKSYVAAAVAHAFLDLHPGSIVVTTAPTFRQVRDVLWRYFGRLHKTARFPMGGKLNQIGLEYDVDWYAIGLSTTYPENFFGYHADNILVIVDEAGGVPDPIFKGVKAITPNMNARVLYIGNPTNPDSYFAQLFENPRVKKFSISAFDSPNLQHVGIDTVEKLVQVMTPPDGVDPLDHKPFENVQFPIPELISPEVVYERFMEWGPDSPAWQALVMGEFPSQAESALIPAELVRMAMEMHGIDPDSNKTYAELSGWNISAGPPEYGLDIARFGPDLNVLTPRRGGWVEQQQIWNKKTDEKKDLIETAERVLQVIDPIDFNTRLNLDDTGLGGGTTDYLRHVGNLGQREIGRPVHQYQLQGYNMSSKQFMSQPEKFHDITSELWWNLRSWFYKKEIALYYDKDLFNQLIGRRWTINKSSGKIQVESKDDYKARSGGKSPDKADSLVLSFAGGLRIMRTPDQMFGIKREEPMRKPFTQGLRGTRF